MSRKRDLRTAHLNMEQLREDFMSGEYNLTSLSEKHEVSPNTIKTRLLEMGLSYTLKKDSLPSKEILESEMRDAEGGAREVAAKYNMSYGYFLTLLQSKGVKIEGALRKSYVVIRTRTQKYPELASDYQEGMSLKDLGKKYGLSRQGIYNVLHAEGTPLRGREYLKPEIEDMGSLLEDIKEMKGVLKIAQKHNISAKNLHEIAQDNGLIVSKEVPAFKLDLPVEEMAEMYEKGMNLKEVANVYNTCAMTVRRKLLDAGYVLRKPGTRSPK